MTRQIFSLVAAGVLIPLLVMSILMVGEAGARRLPLRAQPAVRPWIWLAPALMFIGVVLAYPLVTTIALSLHNASGSSWVGLQNFQWAFSNAMLPVLINNLQWIIIFPAVTVGLALLASVLIDQVRYEPVARIFLIIPTAMSFVAGSVIWRMMYAYEPPFQPQVGTLNAILDLFGAMPIAWLIDSRFNNFALIFVAVWMSLGVATLILSAGLKAIPKELSESARIDGANEWHVFRHVTLPSLWPTILVVVTTKAIFTLKVFDIVYVMTNGSYDTDVIANKMYTELFISQNLGHASAIAALLLLMASPVIIMNIRQVRAGAAN